MSMSSVHAFFKYTTTYSYGYPRRGQRIVTANPRYSWKCESHRRLPAPLQSNFSESVLMLQSVKKIKSECFVLLILLRKKGTSLFLLLLHLMVVVSSSYLVPFANAVLYSPDTKVPRTGELALRRAIPANPKMKAAQDSLEDISYLLRIPQRKPYATMEADVKKALKMAVEEKDSFVGNLKDREDVSKLYTSFVDTNKKLIQYIKEKDADRVSVGLSNALDTLAELEILQAPGLSFLLPTQYKEYPRFTGRGVVELTIEKSGGSTFFPASGGEAKNVAKLKVVVDGYSAPLTAGNFVKLVIDGAYDGIGVKCTDQAVVSDNENKDTGYSVPIEVMPSGEFEPLYKTTLSIQDGELPVLPLSVYGALAMAHNPVSEEYSSPSQFFFYLYDKRNAGLGGLSFDEGQFSVFGYVIGGKDVLSQIKSGDVIQSAKIVEGLDHLIIPNTN